MKSLFAVNGKGVRAALTITLLALLWSPAVSRAQSYTQVSATVKDQAGAAYAGGSWQANLDISGVPTGQPVTFQRTTSFQTAYSGQMDSFGHFSVALPSNDAIAPVNTTQWDFKFCQHYSTATQSPAPACFGLTLAITGVSMDITSQVQAASASLGPITPGLVGGSLLPTVTNTYDLGSPTATWANLHATNATLGSPLPVSSGGTGSSTAGSNIPSVLPVPINQGGTGTTTPTLAAGSNIGISGSWPNQTIGVTGRQGSDSNLLTAGTVSGSGTALCTDANGGATTAGCERVIAIPFVIDGGGSAITTGVKGVVVLPFSCTLTGWSLTADQSGSVQIDVLRSAWSTSPSYADITGGNYPTLSSAVAADDLSLSGWTTALSANDILEFAVNSASTVQRVTATLYAEVP